MNADGQPTTTDARLDALDAAAVGLLEPLIVAMPFEAGGAENGADWRARLAQALDRLSRAALPLELAGLAQTATLLAGHLRESPPGAPEAPARDAASEVLHDSDAALELALAEGWVGDAIAFCSGQLGSDESASLVGRLRDWPGLDERLTPERASALAMRLRADAHRIGQATRASLPEAGTRPAQAGAEQEEGGADGRPDPLLESGAGRDGMRNDGEAQAEEPQLAASDAGALKIGADELQMLAEAAAQLDEEFTEALAGAVDFESFAQVGDAIERYARAIAYVGLVPVSDALFAWHRNLERFAHEPERFGAAHRQLLGGFPSLWEALFELPSPQRAREALAPLGDASWPVPVDPATLDAARRAFASVVTVGTRRVAAPDGELDDEAMSLSIPPDADREVVDNLLRELPALSTAFSVAIELAQAGSGEALARAQRIAHTLKGSANTVGVRGIASLTHRLEDLLQLLEAADGAPLESGLADVLSDAADCVAEMSEAVAGMGDPPAHAREVHRAVGEWIARLLGEPETQGEPAAEHASPGDASSADASSGDSWPADASWDDASSGDAGPTDASDDVSLQRASTPDGPREYVPGEDVSRENVPGDDASLEHTWPADASRDGPSPEGASPNASTWVDVSSPNDASVSGRAPVPQGTARSGASASPDAAAAPDGASLPPERADPSDRADRPADPSAQEWLRVPASLIERLLAFANEASILLSQAQEQAVEVDRVRSTLVGGTDQLQDLSAELERLVDLRGSMLSERRERDDFDPLELDEHNDLQMVSRRIAESGADGRLIEQQLGRNVAALRDSLSQLERLQVDLREAALQTRTIRVETVVPRWTRTVRQAARMARREAALHVEGEGVEVDAQLLQLLVEPVGHLLRNAVDHGIEPPDERERLGKPRAGRVVLRFERDGGDLVIDCADDGRGLDLPAIRARAIATGLVGPDETPSDAALARMVLVSGFSTRERATQLSGRGIGLDVVEQMAREQRGSVSIDTRHRAGTRVRVRLPVRLAALPVVVVRSATHVIGLSVREVERIVPGDATGDVDAKDGQRVVRLEDVLGLPEDAFAAETSGEARASVVLEVRMPHGDRIAVRVPEPGQPRNVVLRPLAAFVPPIAGFEGATVLGDGAVAPVYDLPRLLAEREGGRAAPALQATRPALPVCLVVDDSVSVRRMMEQFVRDLGYEPDSAGDGVEALERVRRRVPSIVLVDLEMPRMNGVEFVRVLRGDDATRRVPVVMITSRSSEKHRTLAQDAGVDVFLTKPYTEDVLASHINALLQPRGGY